MQKVKAVVKCDNCGHTFKTTYIKGSMVDWQCEECGKRLGMNNMKVIGNK